MPSDCPDSYPRIRHIHARDRRSAHVATRPTGSNLTAQLLFLGSSISRAILGRVRRTSGIMRSKPFVKVTGDAYVALILS